MNCEKMYYDLKKKTNYLYEITYKDYIEDVYYETIGYGFTFGCSCVRNKNYFGRNFDFFFNDIPEFVVKVERKEDRLASIGIALSAKIREKGMKKHIYDKELEVVPNATMDGINECGVVCAINVVPGQDVPELTGTNPEAEDLHVVFIPRFILDNAKSADEAIELLKERNIITTPNVGNNIHVMLADSEKTYIIEFIGNKMIVQKKLDKERVMTNYYTNLKELTEHSHGVERAEILKDNYKEGSTFCGMRKLLQKVRFSNVYRFDNEKEFYSEFATQSQIKTKESPEWEELLEQVDLGKKAYWITRAENKRYPANISTWLTVHNTTYDIDRRFLRISVQEDYTKYFDFKLD